MMEKRKIVDDGQSCVFLSSLLTYACYGAMMNS